MIEFHNLTTNMVQKNQNLKGGSIGFGYQGTGGFRSNLPNNLDQRGNHRNLKSTITCQICFTPKN